MWSFRVVVEEEFTVVIAAVLVSSLNTLVVKVFCKWRTGKGWRMVKSGIDV